MIASQLPRVAITLGDPAGIGPEIALKALATTPWQDTIEPVLIGDAAVVEQVIAACELSIPPLSESPKHGEIEFIDVGSLETTPHFGEVTEAHGRAALAYLRKACELANNGEVSALVTGPISKEATWLAGSKYPGHTELLTDLLRARRPREVMTMFYLRTYKIFFLTRHLSLAAAIASLSIDETVRALGLVQRYMGSFGKPDAHIAVAAANPHAGENGNLGREEVDILGPAVDLARSAGMNVSGPVAADAVFYQAHCGKYDAVLSLFHDQGHIAAKSADFYGTVTCQLGLPVIRTSVDHGTAFDIAGTWTANHKAQEVAMEAAIELLYGKTRTALTDDEEA
jgi:4-hydroxythreonine-4-phosphate dehydrogenase